IHRALYIGAHLHVLAAADHAQLLDAGDLLGEADAARAVDATCHVGPDEGTQVLVGHRALTLVVAGQVAPEADRQILQLALPALVTDRAVERVIDEQEFHGGALRADGARGLGEDLHALHHRGGAGRQGLGRLLHLHQAHAAVGRDRELLVVAEARHIGAVRLGDADEHLALARLHRHAVDLDIDQVIRHAHVRAPLRPPPAPPERRSRCCGHPDRSSIRTRARTARGSSAPARRRSRETPRGPPQPRIRPGITRAGAEPPHALPATILITYRPPLTPT